jgi:hypothetical protein
MGLIKRQLIKFLMKKKPSKQLETADELLKISTDDYNKVLKNAEKINSANALLLRTKHLKQQLRESLDDDDDDDDDNDDEGNGGDMADDIFNNLITSFVKNKVGGTNGSAISDAVKNLTPENIEQLKERFLNS